VTLFGDEPFEPIVARKPGQPSTAAHWSANTTTAKCVDCQAAQHAGAAILARRATRRRTVPGQPPGLYCYPHAIPRYDEDARQAQKAKVTAWRA
jgi:hypothetical protein